jgi:hypothetical protein
VISSPSLATFTPFPRRPTRPSRRVSLFNCPFCCSVCGLRLLLRHQTVLTWPSRSATMKTSVLVSALLSAVVVAQPHAHGHKRRAHAHPHPHRQVDKRGAVVTEWVTETVWETVTALVGPSTTEFIRPSPKTAGPKVTVATTTTTQPAGAFYEGPSQAPAQTNAPPAPPPPYVLIPHASPLYLDPPANTPQVPSQPHPPPRSQLRPQPRLPHPSPSPPRPTSTSSAPQRPRRRPRTRAS